MRELSGPEAASWLIRNLGESLRAMAKQDNAYIEHESRVNKTARWLSKPTRVFMESHSSDAARAMNSYYVRIIREVVNWQNANWRELRDRYLAGYRLFAEYGYHESPEFRFMFKPRRTPSGMKAPLVWTHHYQALHASNWDCLMSGIVQNVVLGNPAAGETRAWRN